jgi:uncharacterized protein (DUF2236 family)
MTALSYSQIPIFSPLQRRLDAFARDYLSTEDMPFDFRSPPGEEALVPPDAISWRIFKNPIALFIGGVSAVILELAEPAVRTGVWEFSSFRSDPVKRLKRTGLAAMITVYGAKTRAQEMIAHVVRMHERVAGLTPGGEAYRANDPKLLTWVQATAAYGFVEAYHRFVTMLSDDERDRLYAEGAPAAELYGAADAPRNRAELNALLDSMRHRLEPSPIIFEFLDIMRNAPALPRPFRPVQRLLVRAAVDMTPDWVRDRLGLGPDQGLRLWERPLVKAAGVAANRLMLRSSPAVESCLRLGLPADYLYRR